MNCRSRTSRIYIPSVRPRLVREAGPRKVIAISLMDDVTSRCSRCIVGVIGPNGAGDDALRMITGQEHPYGGILRLSRP